MTLENENAPEGASMIQRAVAKNLSLWMAERADLGTQLKVSAASTVAQTTIGRILRGEVGVTMETVYLLATTFGRDPSELLRMNEPASLEYDRAGYSRLPRYEKVRVEAFVKHVIAEHESGKGLRFETTEAYIASLAD